jgi:hypothetical protein
MLTTRDARNGPSGGGGHVSATNSYSLCTGTANGMTGSAGMPPAMAPSGRRATRPAAAIKGVGERPKTSGVCGCAGVVDVGEPRGACTTVGAADRRAAVRRPRTLMSAFVPLAEILKNADGSDLWSFVQHSNALCMLRGSLYLGRLLAQQASRKEEPQRTRCHHQQRKADSNQALCVLGQGKTSMPGDELLLQRLQAQKPIRSVHCVTPARMHQLAWRQ